MEKIEKKTLERACPRVCIIPAMGLMGLGHEHYSEDAIAWASDFRTSESNHRHFYQRRLDLMTTGI